MSSIFVPRAWLALALALALTSALAGCNDAPSDVRPWAAADHEPPPDRPIAPQTPRRAAPQVAPGVSAANAAAKAPDTTLVEVAWARNCARCHGATGMGDGPEAPMYKPPNLTDPAVTSGRTDDELAAAITRGKGKMPAFDLPPDVVRGLVARVRLLGGAGAP